MGFPFACAKSCLIFVPGRFMRWFKAFFAVGVFGAVSRQPATAQRRSGAQGLEGEPYRAQPWPVPSPDPATSAFAVLFGPPGDGPFRLASIAHASVQNLLRRAQMPQPEYRALAAWPVARSFAVSKRRGHGATGGNHLEDQRGCAGADYFHAGRATAEAAAFGRGANVPVIWWAAANDSYFPPDLSRQLADAFHRDSGESFHVLAATQR